ncbi:MAG: FecR domain-containing protein, partial [Spirochaetaceae bacterium]
MARRDLTTLICVGALSIVLLLAACGQAEMPAEPEPAPEDPVQTGPAIEEEELPEVDAPAVSEALLTFFTGDVFVDDAGEWVYADIGETYTNDDTLFVETGYAELQFGETAVIRLQENTRVTLSEVSLEPGSGDVELGLASGGVISKVERLTQGDSFRVRTDSAVMGVRGTEFAVRVGENRDTNVAVREGRVSVLPASVDLGALERRARQAGSEELAAALREVEEAAPVVEANQESSVTAERVAARSEESAEVIRQIEDVVSRAESEPEQVSAEDIQQITAIARREVEETSREAVTPAQETTEESSQNLEQTEQMRLLPVRLTRPEEPEEEEEPEVRLVRVALRTTPGEAQIVLQGFPVGRGRFSGLFPEGEELSFAIRSEGYEPAELDVVADRGRSLSVSL